MTAQTGVLLNEDDGTSEALEPEGGEQGMGAPGCEGVRHRVAARGDRFIAARSPAAVEVKALNGRGTHDRTRVRGDVDSTGPLAHELQATEAWKELEHGRHRCALLS